MDEDQAVLIMYVDFVSSEGERDVVVALRKPENEGDPWGGWVGSRATFIEREQENGEEIVEEVMAGPPVGEQKTDVPPFWVLIEDETHVTCYAFVSPHTWAEMQDIAHPFLKPEEIH